MKKTNGRVPEVIDNLNLTAMLLLNAIYFKGNWKYEFDLEKTKADWLFLSDIKVKKVDFMLSSGFDYTYILMQALMQLGSRLEETKSHCTFFYQKEQFHWQHLLRILMQLTLMNGSQNLILFTMPIPHLILKFQNSK